MEILKAKLESGIGRAEEYRLLGKNHPEGLNVHIEYITDLIKPIIGSLRCQVNPVNNVDCNKLLSDAKETLNNLQIELDEAERGGVCPALSKVREKLETSSGLKLPSFDGTCYEFHSFITRFSNFMHKAASIPNAVRMIILKSCLTGEPFDFVSALPTSPSNYPLVSMLLEDVYGNSSKSLNTRQLFQRLNELPRVSMNDGVRFRETFWKLESILQSMNSYGVDVNESLCLRFLYLRKFSEKTLLTVLVKDTEMSLPEIQREIRHLVNVEELHLKTEREANITENCCPSGGKSVVSEVSAEKLTNVDGHKGVAAATTVKNESTPKQKDKELSTPESSKSDDQSSAKESEIESQVVPLSTVCTDVKYRYSKKKTSVRLRILLQNCASASLITEAAAKRLGIDVNPEAEKTLHLHSNMGFEFTATNEYYKLLLPAVEDTWDTINVHIVDNTFAFSADDVPGADINDFLTEHPELSHLKLEDTGRGRPIDIFLSGAYYWKYMVHAEDGCPRFQTMKSGWRLKLTKFGWLLHAPIESNDKFIICSYSSEGYSDPPNYFRNFPPFSFTNLRR